LMADLSEYSSYRLIYLSFISFFGICLYRDLNPDPCAGNCCFGFRLF